MTTTRATYSKAIAFGVFHSWACGRALNNRGTVLVVRLGGKLWRCDTRQPTTVGRMVADGWSRS